MLRIQESIAMAGRVAVAVLYAATSAILVVMASLLFLQVVFRYGLHVAIPWSEEIARFLLVWFSLLASCVAGHLGQHFAFGFVVGRLPLAVRDPFVALTQLINAVVVGVLAYYCFHYLDTVRGLYSTATEIDLRIAYASMPVSFAILSFMFAAEFADMALSFKTGRRFSRWPRRADEAASGSTGLHTILE